MKIKIYLVFLSVLLTGELIYAQSPGGVSTNLTLWVKSNAGTHTTGASVDSWDYANVAKTFTGVTTTRPALVSNVINFNPSIRFDGVDDSLVGPTGANAPITATNDTYTAFAVWQSNSTTAFQRVWEQGAGNGAAADVFSFATWNDGHYGVELGIPPFSQGIQRPYAGGAWNISQINLLAEGANDIQIIDDRNISTGFISYSSGATRSIGNTVNHMGSNWDNTGPLNGDIAEIIVYDRSVDSSTGAKERNKIFSYLALKYGINIHTNLLSSAGTVIWNNTAPYNNNVFGIGQDNGSGLTVTSSNSIETGGGSGIGQSGLGNIVIKNPSALANQGFLIVGNNDASAIAQSVNADIPPVASGSTRLGREWRVGQSGTVGTVTLTIDFTGFAPAGGTNANNYRMIVDQDGNGNFTDGAIRFYTPSSVAGGIATFNNVTLNNNEIFTFITQIAGGILPVTWSDFNVKLMGSDAHLNWTIENNSDADHYEIEHSTDGINFTSIGSDANIANVKTYSFVNRGLVSGNHFYRIKEVDNNGNISYSSIVKVAVKSPDFVVYLLSNPVRSSSAEVRINTTVTGTVAVELWSSAGLKISEQQSQISVGSNNIQVPMDRVSSGNYILKIKMNETTQTVQLMKL